MKRSVSLIIAAIMIFASFAAAITSAAVEGLPTAEVEAPYFDEKPVIDGRVSEDEWGEPTVWVDQADVGESIYLSDDGAPEANEFNTFFYRNPAATYDVDVLNMSYMVWLRWDEDYYYVAVKVNDPDGHSLKNGKGETWNGDALQMRVDPEGYNAVSPLGPEMYDAEYDGKPWSRDDIDDFCFGFVEAAGGFTEAWNNATGTGITSFSGGSCKAAVVPAGANFNYDTATGVTTYEIAIPWGYIDNYSHNYSDYSSRNPNGAIGREYGMTAVVYNADGNTGEAKFNAGLSWGSGIINAQQEKCVRTCGGSNKVTLTGDKVSEDGTYTGDYVIGEYVPPVISPHYPTAIDESVHIKLDYEREADMDVLGYRQNGEWVEEPGNPRNHVARWEYDDATDSGWNENNYLSTGGEHDLPPTYLAEDCSYTMEYDVKVINVENFEPGYNSALYHWFGGSSTVDYECGYDFDLGKFVIVETSSRKILAEDTYPFTLNEWHHIVFQYYRDNCEMRFYFDPPMENGTIRADAAPMFRMSYRYFDCPGKDECGVILRRMNCQILLDNVEYYNFVDGISRCNHDLSDHIVTQEPTCTTEGKRDEYCWWCHKYLGTEVIPALGHDFEEEFTVDVEPTETTPGQKSRHCTRCDEVTDVTALPPVLKGDADGSGTVNMKDVLLLRKTLAGAAESEPFYDYNADLDGDGTITMKDVLILRKILAGA